MRINWRIFIQYLNPEILSLYGVSRQSSIDWFIDTAVTITKYALLLSDEAMIMPASYLFEVAAIDEFLRRIDAVRSSGKLNIASPTPDLGQYSIKKKVEYRPELSLFKGYEGVDPTPLIKARPITWIPRIYRSSSGDITTEWVNELHQSGGVWQGILERISRESHAKPLSDIETDIESVPERLEGKAFIFRYAEPLLQIGLELNEETRVSLLISRAYLESYLNEYNALILTDTPLGSLDCGIHHTNVKGYLQRVSYHEIDRALGIIGIRHHIQQRLAWKDLLALTDETVFRWAREFIIRNSNTDNGLFDAVVLLSKYRPEAKPLPRSSRGAYVEVTDRLWRFYDAVSPYLATAVIGEGTTEGHNQVVPRTIEMYNRMKAQQVILLSEEMKPVNNDVFVIHGRDTRAAGDMKQLLRAAGLVPVEWEEAVSFTGKPGPFILEVLQAAFARVQAVVILFTPDEVVKLKDEFIHDHDEGYERNPGDQPRPNVLIEAGMALALNPNQTIIVQIGKVRPISDLSGIHVLYFTGEPSSRDNFRSRLELAGCRPRTTGGEYFTIGFDYLKP